MDTRVLKSVHTTVVKESESLEGKCIKIEGNEQCAPIDQREHTEVITKKRLLRPGLCPISKRSFVEEQQAERLTRAGVKKNKRKKGGGGNPPLSGDAGPSVARRASIDPPAPINDKRAFFDGPIDSTSPFPSSGKRLALPEASKSRRFMQLPLGLGSQSDLDSELDLFLGEVKDEFKERYDKCKNFGVERSHSAAMSHIIGAFMALSRESASHIREMNAAKEDVALASGRTMAATLMVEKLSADLKVATLERDIFARRLSSVEEELGRYKCLIKDPVQLKELFKKTPEYLEFQYELVLTGGDCVANKAISTPGLSRRELLREIKAARPKGVADSDSDDDDLGDGPGVII